MCCLRRETHHGTSAGVRREGHMVAHVAFDTLHSVDAASRNRLAARHDEHRGFAVFLRDVFVVWLVEGRGHLLRRLGDSPLGLPAIPFRKDLGMASIVFVIDNAALPELHSGLIVSR
jgi:hypothetical protein